MRLWIVEMTEGSRLVVYAEDASTAVAGVRDADRPLVTRVREWPAAAPFRMAFVPATPADGDRAMHTWFWDGVTDWGERPPRATTEALGDVLEAAQAQAQQAATLENEHEAGGHEPGANEHCPTCFAEMLKEALARRHAGRSRFDA